jgi:hypothetical protein
MAKKPKPKARNNSLWLISLGTVILVGSIWFALHLSGRNTPKESVPQLIATLAPELYSGRARAAYQAAKDIPEVLVELPCYCGCKDGLGHKSNLYCFADEHGSICDLCQTIALEGQEMHRKGMPTSEIREKIRAAYGNAHSD